MYSGKPYEIEIKVIEKDGEYWVGSGPWTKEEAEVFLEAQLSTMQKMADTIS